MGALWLRLPVLIQAVLSGGVVALAGTGPWAFLSGANLKYFPSLPWSVPPTALYLWLFWRYLEGAGWPRSTSDARRARLRANRLSEDVWGAALFAGIVGLVGVILLLRVMSRMVALPQQQLPDLSQIPVLTLLAILAMSAIVAGVAEEASFRGYMQGPIERRHGPVVAILVTGILFGFLHFTHPEVTLALMPYYVAVAVVYGTLAYLTNSILPSLFLHAGGNFLSGLGILAGGRDLETPVPTSLIWETGVDATFWMSCAALLVVLAAAVWGVSGLAAVARKYPGGELNAKRS